MRNYAYLITLTLLLHCMQAISGQSCSSAIPQSTNPSDFTINSDGTVEDRRTGLMWKRCPEGLSGATCASGFASSMRWQDALNTASNSTFAGYDNWRLPNIQELRTIVEDQCADPTINANIFPRTIAINSSVSEYWSSSPEPLLKSAGWLLDFRLGNVLRGQSFGRHLVRLVRDVR